MVSKESRIIPSRVHLAGVTKASEKPRSDEQPQHDDEQRSTA
jgi:hypothetical protein